MTIFDNTQHRFRRKKGVREFQKFHPPIPTPTSIFVVPFPITLAKHYILDLCESYRGVYKLSFYQKHRESSQYTWCVFVRASLHMRREENQLDVTECFIALMIRSTYFGYFYAHHQELETICVLLPLWCAVLGYWLSAVRCRAAGYVSRKRDVARLVQHPRNPLALV